MENVTIQKQPRPSNFFRSLLGTIKHMHGCQSIIGNLIAIALSGLLIFLLQINWLLPNLGSYHRYFIIGFEILIIIQIIKSSKKSLFFPSLCLGVAGVGLIIHHVVAMSSTSLHFLQGLMLLGVVGLCIAIFHMR